MRFMIAWKIPPGCYKAAIEAFLGGGAPVPARAHARGPLAHTGISFRLASIGRKRRPCAGAVCRRVVERLRTRDFTRY